MLIERAMEEANQEERALREQEKVNVLPLSLSPSLPLSLLSVETDLLSEPLCILSGAAPGGAAGPGRGEGASHGAGTYINVAGGRVNHALHATRTPWRLHIAPR